MRYIKETLTVRKGLYRICLVFMLCALTSSTPVNNGNVISTINGYIAKGDANALSSYFSNTTEMNILGEVGFYSKNQAVSVLTDFFKAHSPKSYTIHESGSTTENSQYSIGVYVSGQASYKIYYVVKNEGATYKINKFIIEQS
ncbi:MAG: DUF4783 domain-containing protein [Bacteroidales bacterium]|nr:DUF4783 domain-containing protein [Bacteroidales bacterium]